MCILMLESCGYVKWKHIYHGTTDERINQFTYIGLRSKPSNAILSLKNSLSVIDIDGVKHLLQTIHCLCEKWNLETNI